MKRWNKFIGQKKARELSKKFCEDFNVGYCEIYYVDKILDEYEEDCEGIYIYTTPSLILIKYNTLNPIGILMHELTHHLEYYGYKFNQIEENHGYYYQLAKKRVIRWCENNISEISNWRIPLKSKQKTEYMREFKL